MLRESALFIRQEDSTQIIDLTDNLDPQGVLLTGKTKLQVSIDKAHRKPETYYLEVLLNRDKIFPFGDLPGSGFVIRGNDLNYIHWKKRPVELAVKILREFSLIKLILEPKGEAIYDDDTGMYPCRRPDEFWNSETGLFQLTAEAHFNGMKIRHVVWEEPEFLYDREIPFPMISRVARIAEKYPAEAEKMRKRQLKMKRE